MSFTRNFEIKRWVGTLLRSGQDKSPAGTSLVLGTICEPDPANPGLIKQSGSTSTRGSGLGVLWFEHIQYQGVDPNLVLYVDRDTAPANALVQIVTGAGVKVQYRNTIAITLADGRTRAARSMINVTSLNVGDYLTVAAGGTLTRGTANGTAPAATDVMRVTAIDVSLGAGREIVDAVLLAE